MVEEIEEIKGVIKNLLPSVGTKITDVIITNRRLLLIRTRSALTASMVGGIVGGAIGGAVGYAADKKKEKEVLTNKSLNELLASDKKNMSIPTEDLKGIRIKKGLLSADLWVILKTGKKLHYGSHNKRDYDNWKNVLKDAIPEKLIT